MFNIYFKEMKKFFSLIALVGIIAACTPEQLGTAFKLAGAKGTINVEVQNLDGTPYAGQFTLSGYESIPGVEAPVISGNKATINFQLADSQSIDNAITVTLAANGPKILKAATSQVIVPKVLAGGVAELGCTIKVGENVDGYYIDSDYLMFEDIVEFDVAFLANSHYATYTHSATDYAIDWLFWDIIDEDIVIPSWYVNNSDQILSGTVDVPYKYGYQLEDAEVNDLAGFSHTIKAFVDEWAEIQDYYDEGVVVEPYPYPFQVSGWAMWNVWVAQYAHPILGYLYAYELDKDNNIIDEENPVVLATAEGLAWESDWNKVELPYPGMPGSAHYEYGHGHGHGGDNAGGGISFNE